MGQLWDYQGWEAESEYANLSTPTALITIRKTSIVEECMHVWIDLVSSFILQVDADTDKNIARDLNLVLNYLGAESKSPLPVDLSEPKHCHEHHGWQNDLLAVRSLVHELNPVGLLRDTKEKRIQDEMGALSSALALHLVRSRKAMEDRKLKMRSGTPQVRRSESINRIKEVDMKNIGIENLLFTITEILYRQWTTTFAAERLLPATGPRFVGNSHSVHATGDSQSHYRPHNRPTMLTAMIYEIWCPLWAGLYDFGFIVRNLITGYTTTVTCTILAFVFSAFVI